MYVSGVRNIGYSENIVYLRNEWFLAFLLVSFTCTSIKLSSFVRAISLSSQNFPRFFKSNYISYKVWIITHHNIHKLHFHFSCSKFVVSEIDLPIYVKSNTKRRERRTKWKVKAKVIPFWPLTGQIYWYPRYSLHYLVLLCYFWRNGLY